MSSRYNQARQGENSPDGGDYGRPQPLWTRSQASDCGAATLFTQGSKLRNTASNFIPGFLLHFLATWHLLSNAMAFSLSFSPVDSLPAISCHSENNLLGPGWNGGGYRAGCISGLIHYLSHTQALFHLISLSLAQSVQCAPRCGKILLR